jgi:hypothetical protein
MRYMLLVYTNEKSLEGLTPEEEQRIKAQHWAVIEEAGRRGIFLAADPLEPTATATTVRTDGGKMIVSDGPFAETKEHLAGYYMLDCKDLDEAIEWAAKIPTACGGATGCIEVRPIREIRKPVEASKAGENVKA